MQVSPQFAFAVAFSPDSKVLAVGIQDGTIVLYDADKGAHVRNLVGHRGMIRALDFSTKEPMLISASEDRIVGVWNWQTGQNLAALRGHSQMVLGAAISPDGARIASAGEDVKIWNPKVNQFGSRMIAGSVFAFAFSTDGKYLAMTHGMHGHDITVKDMATDMTIAELNGHDGSIKDLAFSPDNKLLASASLDCTVKIWNLAERKAIVTFRDHGELGVTQVAFSADGRWVASGAPELLKADVPLGPLRIVPAQVKVWDPHTGKIRRAMALDKRVTIGRLAFGSSPDRLAVTCSNVMTQAYTIRHWDIATGNDIFVAPTSANGLTGLAYEPRRKIFASASGKLLDEATGKEVHTLVGGGFSDIAFSPDGQRIATVAGGTATLWEPETAVEIMQLHLAAPSLGFVRFSPDGRTIAVSTALASSQGSGALWVWQTPR